MPSTYSNLKIQLMATGENATTWGNITNVNLGTALEEAIVGSADVTFASNDQTLTLTDTNATQAARNMRLRCTGATGGSPRNLIVPSIEKPYIVLNDCADTITVKTSAGTGIAVPAGKTMWVYSDGTNVVDVANHLTSLTLGTPLPLLQGGTGSNTNSGARTNLGSTTVGDSFFTLTNPDAVTFPRINANNTVTARNASDFRSDIGAVGLTDTQTLTNKTTEKLILNDGYTEEVFAVVDGGTVNLDPNNGSIQTWTLGANRTPGQVNWADGQSITLMVDDGSAFTITWSTLAVVWETNSGSAPTLATSGFTVIVLWKVGAQIYGARVGNA